MKVYQEFAKHLDRAARGARAVRITVPGYLPLSVEEIGSSGDGYRLVSLCQYGEQNGDLMRDPDLVFLFHNCPMARQPNRCHFGTTTWGSFRRSIGMTRRAGVPTSCPH
jgi:hypothetical protein